MKLGKIIINLLSLLVFTINLQANDNNPTTLAQAEKWLSTANEKGFLENKGQMIDNEGKPVTQVLFKTEAQDLNIWITQNGLTIQTLHVRKEPIPESELSEFEKDEVKHTGKAKTKKYFDWERVDIDLKGATIKKENILKENPLQGHNNYFFPICPDGIYGVMEYEKITIKDVYPGIDWVLYRNKDKGFKYDFIVHSGADYHQIELIYKSKTPVNINEQGELEMFTIYGNVKENKPISFYENQEITTRFTQNYQKPTKISGDNGYETSISFLLNTSLNNNHSTIIIDPQLTWATFFGGNGFDGPLAIDTDNSGNIFISGYGGSSNFPVQNTGTFFQGYNALGGGDGFIMKFDTTGNYLWGTYYGGDDLDFCKSINTDNSGNVFVAGYTESTNFPTQNSGVFYQGIYGGGISDVFILKFDNAGNRLWATYYGGTGDDKGYSIVTDNNNNVFVTGYTASTNFPVQDTGTFFQGTTGGSFRDAFILKFDNAGNRLWATYYGGNGTEQGNSVAVDNNGNLFVTGYTQSSNFPVQNSGTFFQGSNAGANDVFLMKFDNNGNRLWATYYGGSGDDRGGSSIGIDINGNIFVTGYTTSSNFPVQNTGTFFQGSNAGTKDVFLMKFDNNGNRLWATYYGGSGDDVQFDYDNLAVTSCGKVYMSFDTESIALPSQSPCDTSGYYDDSFNGGPRDIFLVLFSNSGNLLWGTYVGGDGSNFREALALDNNDNLFMSGEWTNVTNSNSYPLTNPGGGTYYDGTFNGNDDGYVLKFINPTCLGLSSITLTSTVGTDSQIICLNTPIVTTIFSTTGTTGANIIGLPLGVNGSWSADSVTISGTPTIAGTFNYIVTLTDGCGAVTASGSITVLPTSISTDTQSACNSFTWIDGITYFSSTNTPTFTITGGAASGCDSLVTLNLTINSNTETDIQTACDSYTWIDGNTYTSNNNTATYTLINSLGCDSVVTLNLTITPATIGTDAITSCLPVTWIDGITYSSSTNTPTFTIVGGAASGCDSVVTLNLTFTSATTGIDAITSCSPITWLDGITYTTSTNTPTFTIVGGATSGCDSMVTLNLTISATTSGTDTQTACESYTWIDGNSYTVSTNFPTFIIIGGASSGCDSVVTLNLTITSATTGTDVITSCLPITWIDGNTYTLSTNTPTFTLTNTVGCDSVVTLDLTINNPTSGIDTQTSCEFYTWIDGNTYTASTNTPTFTIVGGAANGCDSIITLNLTINNSTTSTDVQATCNSYVWIDGNTYTADNNTATFTLTNSAGCDSVVTLNLTINNSTTSTDVQTACNTYTWIDGNTYFSSTSLPTVTLTNSLGCDSIITLNLTLVTPVTTTQTFTECQGFSVAVSSNTYTTTGVFTDVINGCDTMITNLTINDAPQFTLIKEDDNCGEHIGSVLVNVTSSISPVTYNWNTGSNDSILSNLPTGTYTVIVNDGSGCSNANTTNIVDLNLDCESFIFIPSVFTPNGDGQNDEFIIQLKGLEFIGLEIYNRWGLKLFESTQKNRGWDGRTETDTKATDGTYFFIVSYKTTDGEIMIKKGTLTLLR